MGYKSNRTKTTIQIKYGPGFRQDLIQEFKTWNSLPKNAELHPTPGLIARRVQNFKSDVNDIVPPGSNVSVWIALDMGETLAEVVPQYYGADTGREYSADRGANTAVAKTMKRLDGRGFDMFIPAHLFINLSKESEREVVKKDRILKHLAAHESQHIVLAVTGLDVADLIKLSTTGSLTLDTLVPYVAVAINEFQAELSANRLSVAPDPHDFIALESDLDAFRRSATWAKENKEKQGYEAYERMLRSTGELVKGIAYTAALIMNNREYVADDSSRSVQWSRYMSSLWGDMFEIFSSIPAAGEIIEGEIVGQIAQRIANRILEWFDEIGFSYSVYDYCGQTRWRCTWNMDDPL